MTVLVTGAAGFLGRSVCGALTRAGAPVIELSRSCACRVDLTNSSDVAAAAHELQHVTHVVHLASPVPGVQSTRTMLVDAERIFVGFLALLAELPAVEHVTYLSSVAVYGTRFDAPPTEDAPLPEPANPYALHKRVAEARLASMASTFGWTLAALRATQIYGPHEPHGLGLTRMLKAATLGERVTLDNGGEDERDLLHVEDVGAAVAKATLERRAGVINVSAGYGVRVKELARMLQELLGETFELEVLPITRERTSFVYDNTRMRDLLGIVPRPIRDGVKSCVEAHLA